MSSISNNIRRRMSRPTVPFIIIALFVVAHTGEPMLVSDSPSTSSWSPEPTKTPSYCRLLRKIIQIYLSAKHLRAHVYVSVIKFFEGWITFRKQHQILLNSKMRIQSILAQIKTFLGELLRCKEITPEQRQILKNRLNLARSDAVDLSSEINKFILQKKIERAGKKSYTNGTFKNEDNFNPSIQDISGFQYEQTWTQLQLIDLQGTNYFLSLLEEILFGNDQKLKEKLAIKLVKMLEHLIRILKQKIPGIQTSKHLTKHQKASLIACAYTIITRFQKNISFIQKLFGIQAKDITLAAIHLRRLGHY